MKTVLSPKVQWKELKHFPLRKIKEYFKIADFEREVNTKNVRNLKTAILDNNFFNNAIFVTNSQKPFVVFDGQHRLSALWLCHIENKLQNYDLMLAIYPKEYARTAYRRTNMGKPLQLRHHLKALDDKTVKFFTELEPWLSHHPRPDKLLYINLLNAITFARGYRIHVDNIDYVIAKTTLKEIEYSKTFLTAIKHHSPVIYKAQVYNSVILRPAFRTGLENKLDESQLTKLFNLMLNDEIIKEANLTRHKEDILRAYERSKTLVLEVLK